MESAAQNWRREKSTRQARQSRADQPRQGRSPSWVGVSRSQVESLLDFVFILFTRFLWIFCSNWVRSAVSLQFSLRTWERKRERGKECEGESPSSSSSSSSSVATFNAALIGFSYLSPSLPPQRKSQSLIGVCIMNLQYSPSNSCCYYCYHCGCCCCCRGCNRTRRSPHVTREI